jgi:hypothetical protein
VISPWPVGEITNLVLDNDEALVQKRQKVSLVQSFIGKRRLEREIAKDIVSVCYEKINVQRDTDRVFDLLPSSLRIEVAMHISLPLVKSSQLFRGCSASFAASLSVLMREITFAGDEILFRTNDVCRELYIIATSSVKILATALDGQDTVRRSLLSHLKYGLSCASTTAGIDCTSDAVECGCRVRTARSAGVSHQYQWPLLLAVVGDKRERRHAGGNCVFLPAPPLAHGRSWGGSCNSLCADIR